MPMSNDLFYALTDALFLKCNEVMRSKGADYAHEDNKLANFERQATSMDLPPLVILRVYLQKHIDAFDAYVKTGKVESEPLEMRIVDIVNYFVLALGQAVASGYEPREDWLRNVLLAGGGVSNSPDIITLDRLRKEVEELGPALTVTHPKKGDNGDEAVEACCNPNGEDCCDGAEEAPK